MGRLLAIALGVIVLALAVTVGPSLLPAPPTPRPTVAVSTPSPTAAPTPSPTPSPSPSPTPAPTPLVSERGNIIVEQPRGIARTRAPLQVSGRARLFEAAFSWRLVDLGGRELGKGFAAASAGAPEFGTFTVSVPFTVTAETNAYIEVFSNSARDGSIDEMVRVPITLLP